MVVSNPLFVGRFNLQKFNATILNEIWPEMIVFTGVGVAVTLISENVHNLGISSSLLTVLGTILGLVISFRTSSAYDRYWEGRRVWTTVVVSSRTLASLIWIHIPSDRPDKTPPKPEPPKTPRKENFPAGTSKPVPLPLLTSAEDRKHERQLKAMLEKKSMVGLVLAFSVAVKHFLRSETGVYYEDLYPLISFLPRYSPTPSNGHALSPMFSTASLNTAHMRHLRSGSIASQSTSRSRPSFSGGSPHIPAEKHGHLTVKPVDIEGQGEIELLPAECPPRVRVYDYLPILLVFKPFVWLFRRILSWVRLRANPNQDDDTRGAFGKRKRPNHLDGNVPLEICLYLSSYIGWISHEGLITVPMLPALLNCIASLQDSFASLERIATTPIPFAYQAHLRMFTWLYLVFLPFQMYPTFGYLTIPAQAMATFMIVGLVEIGQEIENPFDYGENDLDLEAICRQIKHELMQITAHTPPDPWDYMFNQHNHPLAPGDDRAADEILRGTTTRPGDLVLQETKAMLHKNFLDLPALVVQNLQ